MLLYVYFVLQILIKLTDLHGTINYTWSSDEARLKMSHSVSNKETNLLYKIY